MTVQSYITIMSQEIKLSIIKIFKFFVSEHLIIPYETKNLALQRRVECIVSFINELIVMYLDNETPLKWTPHKADISIRQKLSRVRRVFSGNPYRWTSIKRTQ